MADGLVQKNNHHSLDIVDMTFDNVPLEADASHPLELLEGMPLENYFRHKYSGLPTAAAHMFATLKMAPFFPWP